MKTGPVQKADLSCDLRNFIVETIERALVSLSVVDLVDLHVALTAAAVGGAVEAGMSRDALIEQVEAFYDEYLQSKTADEDPRQLALLH